VQPQAGQAVEAAGEEAGEVRGERAGAGVVGEHRGAVLEGDAVGLDDEVAVPLLEQVQRAGPVTERAAYTPSNAESMGWPAYRSARFT
jgi:hypothetical protein